jgi:hypothetical protein
MKKLTIITMLCCFNIAMSMDSNKQDADKQGIIEKLSSQKAPNSFSMGHSVTPANNAQPRFELAPRQDNNRMGMPSKVLSGQLQAAQPNDMNAIEEDIMFGLANNNNNDDDDNMMFDVANANANDNDDDDNDDDDDNMMFDDANDNDNDDDDDDNDDDSPASLIKLKHCSHPGCKKSYAFASDLNRHIKAVHTNRQSVTCRKRIIDARHRCAPEASHTNNNNNNNNNHIADAKHRCGINGCTKEYTQKGKLALHIEASHTNPQSATCRYCSRHFATKPDLEEHIKAKHTNPQSATCRYCNSHFATEYSCKAHERACASNPVYEASMVSFLASPKTPANNNNNNNHITRAKYRCELCPNEYTQRAGLKQHIETIHKQTKHRCGLCNKEYTQKGKLALHIEAKHTNPQSAACRYCSRHFATKFDCKSHEGRCKSNPAYAASMITFLASSRPPANNNNNNNNHIVAPSNMPDAPHVTHQAPHTSQQNNVNANNNDDDNQNNFMTENDLLD